MAQANKTGKSEGVPKETPKRNCLDKLCGELAQVLSSREADGFVKSVVDDGYFDSSLLEQKVNIVARLADIPQSRKVLRQLLKSDSDKIRSFAVSMVGSCYVDDIPRQLTILYKAGAAPGTWTQETAQTELKHLMHRESVARILPAIRKWATDSKPEVRRMLIEGLRPRGVWCKHLDELKADPTPIKSIIVQLLDDKSEYVRKAVANNLNDITKDNPELLCDWISEWQKGPVGPEREWVVKRGLRGLIREGHPRAQQLLGYGDPSQIKLLWKRTTPKQIVIGTHIPFDLVLTNNGRTTTKCRVQLEMQGPGKGSKPRIAKYLLGEVNLEPGDSKPLSKRIRFEHKNSVPRLPGLYQLGVSLNGTSRATRQVSYLAK
jgi:3-methyladenine DNA glycosylase AlkC